jgi:hypothetical protein
MSELADKEAAVQEMQRALDKTGTELLAERSKCRSLQAEVDDAAALRDEVGWFASLCSALLCLIHCRMITDSLVK